MIFTVGRRVWEAAVGKVMRLLEAKVKHRVKEPRNILSWKGPIRILKVQLTDLHRTAPRIAPCAWNSRDSVKHGLILQKNCLKNSGDEEQKNPYAGSGKIKKNK